MHYLAHKSSLAGFLFLFSVAVDRVDTSFCCQVLLMQYNHQLPLVAPYFHCQVDYKELARGMDLEFFGNINFVLLFLWIELLESANPRNYAYFYSS